MSKYKGLKTHEHNRSLAGKICVITGATDGIGKMTARRLAPLGPTLVLVGRNELKGRSVATELQKESKNKNIFFVQADLSLVEQIKGTGKTLLDRYPKIDILINNAGAYFDKRTTTSEGLDSTFALNHLSYFILTNHLLPALKHGNGGRIINVASDAHSGAKLDFSDLSNDRSYSGMRAYGQSKLMNIIFTYEMAKRLQGTPVTVNCLHPGFVASKFGDNNKTLMGAVVWIGKKLIAINETKGTDTQVYLATSPEVASKSGLYFHKCKPIKSSAVSYDPMVAKKLWEYSENFL